MIDMAIAKAAPCGAVELEDPVRQFSLPLAAAPQDRAVFPGCRTPFYFYKALSRFSEKSVPFTRRRFIGFHEKRLDVPDQMFIRWSGRS